MESDEKKLLKETLELARENNRTLKKVHGILKWSRVIKIIYWIILIGSIFGLFYFLQPVIDNFIGAFEGTVSGIKGLQEGAVDPTTTPQQ